MVIVWLLSCGKTFGRSPFWKHSLQIVSIIIDGVDMKMTGRRECLVSFESATQEGNELGDPTQLISQAYLDVTQIKLVNACDAILSNGE